MSTRDTREAAIEAIKDADGWISTVEIARRTGESATAVNHRLRYLRDHDKITWREDGPAYFYRIENDD